MKKSSVKAWACLLLTAILHLAVVTPCSAEDKLAVAIPYPIYKVKLFDSGDPVNALILQNISYRLCSLETNGKIGLGLAASYRSESDSNKWVFNLRPDVRFPSGEPLTAESVQKSFKFAKDFLAKDGSKSSKKLYQRMLNIREINVLTPKVGYFNPGKDAPLTLVFTLSSADPSFDQVAASVPIFEQKTIALFRDEFGRGTLTSGLLGPYIVQENRPEEGVLLQAAPNFYRPGFPRSKQLEFSYYEDAESALSALRVGAVDIVAIPTRKQLKQIEEDPTLVAIPLPYVNLSLLHGEITAPRQYWSKENSSDDHLILTEIIVRKSLKFDQTAAKNFDLSGTFLP